MLDTILRISARDFDVLEFIDRHNIQDAEGVFLQGEKDRRGESHTESGFYVLVSDNLTSKQNVAEVEAFILSNKDMLTDLQSIGITSTFDVGCTVGTTDQFTKSINIPSDILGLMNIYAISLGFSAYPAYDDDENEA